MIKRRSHLFTLAFAFALALALVAFATSASVSATTTGCKSNLRSAYVQLVEEVANDRLLNAEQIRALAKRDRPTNPFAETSMDGKVAQYSLGFKELAQRSVVVSGWREIQASLLLLANRLEQNENVRQDAAEATRTIIKPTHIWSVPFPEKTYAVRLLWSKNSSEPELLAAVTSAEGPNHYKILRPLQRHNPAGQQTGAAGINPTLLNDSQGSFWVASLSNKKDSVNVRRLPDGPLRQFDLINNQNTRSSRVGKYEIGQLPDGRVIVAITYDKYFQVFDVNETSRPLFEDSFEDNDVQLAAPIISSSPTATFITFATGKPYAPIYKFSENKFRKMTYLVFDIRIHGKIHVQAMPDDSLLLALPISFERYEVFRADDNGFASVWLIERENLDPDLYSSWHLTQDGRALLAVSNTWDGKLLVFEPLKQLAAIATFQVSHFGHRPVWVELPQGGLGLNVSPDEKFSHLFELGHALPLARMPVLAETSTKPVWLRTPDGQYYWASVDEKRTVHIYTLFGFEGGVKK